MQKKIFYLCLVGIAFVFQGCPGSINQPQTSVDRTTGFTFVLSPQDSIKVRYYDFVEQPHTKIFAPSNYLNIVTWAPEQRKWDPDKGTIHTPHDEEKHELHLRKLTNYEETIVIEGCGVFINDTYWDYASFRDPADTIRLFWNFETHKQDTVIIPIKPCPYKLEDIIEQLELHYPDIVHRLNDTIEHNFSNYLVSQPKEILHINLP